MCSVILLSVEVQGENFQLLLIPPRKQMFDDSEVYGIFVFCGCCSAVSMWFMHGEVVQAVSERSRVS